MLDCSTGAMDLRVPVEQDRTENRANDVKTNRRGRAWVGTMAYDKRPRHAALYRVDRGRVTRVAEGLTICNGPAFDEPQGRFYLADTAPFTVDVFDLDPATSAVEHRPALQTLSGRAGRVTSGQDLGGRKLTRHARWARLRRTRHARSRCHHPPGWRALGQSGGWAATQDRASAAEPDATPPVEAIAIPPVQAPDIKVLEITADTEQAGWP